MDLKPQDFLELENSTLEIAKKKIVPSIISDLEGKPLMRMGTGGKFDNFFFWDTAFTVIWGRYFLDSLPIENSLDNLYAARTEDGFISREYNSMGEPIWDHNHPIAFAPPLLTWAELSLFELTSDVSRLKKVFPYLKAHHDFCTQQYQASDGLFIGDALGSGMDNLKRYPKNWDFNNGGIELKPEWVHSLYRPHIDKLGPSHQFKWNSQGRWIDLSCQMALDAKCLSEMAKLINLEEESEHYRKKHSNLAGIINDLCWNEDHQFYFDLGYGKQITRYHIGGYWALLAGIVPKSQQEGFISHLSDTKRFDTPVPVPSLSVSDPDFSGDGKYWRGSSWHPTTYMVIKGLEENGFREKAKEISVSCVKANFILFKKTKTLWENLSPLKAEPGNPSQPDFCGWAGLSSVAIPREFLKG